MNSVINSCFMCSSSNNCNYIDEEIAKQVEYVLPEITVTKKKIPLRICTTCKKHLQIFHNFKQESVQNCVEQETTIPSKQAQTCAQTQPNLNNVNQYIMYKPPEQSSSSQNTQNGDNMSAETNTGRHVYTNIFQSILQQGVMQQEMPNNCYNKNTKIDVNNFFQCPICAKIVPNILQKVHMKSHNTNTNADLTHSSSRVNEQISNISCKVIQKNSNVVSHIKTKTEHQCLICRNSYPNAKMLQEHVNFHYCPIGQKRKSNTDLKIESKNFILRKKLKETKMKERDIYKTLFRDVKEKEMFEETNKNKKYTSILKSNNSGQKGKPSPQVYQIVFPNEIKNKNVQPILNKSTDKNSEINRDKLQNLLENADNNQNKESSSNNDVREQPKNEALLQKTSENHAEKILNEEKTQHRVEILRKENIIEETCQGNEASEEILIIEVINQGETIVNEENSEEMLNNENREKTSEEGNSQNRSENSLQEKENIFIKEDIFDETTEYQQSYRNILEENEEKCEIKQELVEENTEEHQISTDLPQKSDSEEEIKEFLFDDTTESQDDDEEIKYNIIINPTHRDDYPEDISSEEETQENTNFQSHKDGTYQLLTGGTLNTSNATAASYIQLNNSPGEYQLHAIPSSSNQLHSDSSKNQLQNGKQISTISETCMTQSNKNFKGPQLLIDSAFPIPRTNTPKHRKKLHAKKNSAKTQQTNDTMKINELHELSIALTTQLQDYIAKCKKNSIRNELRRKIKSINQLHNEQQKVKITKSSSKENKYQLQKDGTVLGIQLRECSVQLGDKLQTDNKAARYQLQNKQNCNGLGNQLQKNSETNTAQKSKIFELYKDSAFTRETRSGIQLQSDNRASGFQLHNQLQSKKAKLCRDVKIELQDLRYVSGIQLQSDDRASGFQLQSRKTKVRNSVKIEPQDHSDSSGNQLQNEKERSATPETSRTQRNKIFEGIELYTDSELIRETRSGIQLQSDNKTIGIQLQNDKDTENQLQASGSPSRTKLLNQLQIREPSSGIQLQSDNRATGIQLQSDTDTENQLQTNGSTLETKLHKPVVDTENQLQIKETKSGIQLQSDNRASEFDNQLQTNGSTSKTKLHNPVANTENQLQIRETKSEIQLQSNNKVSGSQLHTDDTENQLQANEPTSEIKLHKSIGTIGNQLQTSGSISGTSLRELIVYLENQLRKSKSEIQLQKDKIALDSQLQMDVAKLQASGFISVSKLQEPTLNLENQLQSEESKSEIQLHTNITNQLQTSGSISGTNEPIVNIDNQLQKYNRALDPKLHPDIANQLQASETSGSKLQEPIVNIGNQLQTKETTSGIQPQTDNKTSGFQLHKNIANQLQATESTSGTNVNIEKQLQTRETKSEIQSQTDNKTSEFQLHKSVTNQLQTSGPKFETKLHEPNANIENQLQRENKSGIQLHENITNQLHTSGSTSRIKLQEPIVILENLLYTGETNWSSYLINKQEMSINKDNQNRIELITLKKCLICNSIFTKVDSLAVHMKSHKYIDMQTPAFKQFIKDNKKCTVCEKKFDRDCNLINHLKHHITYNFRCQICDKIYQTYDELKNHMKKYMDVKLKKCLVCQKRFEVLSALQSHLRYRHTKKKH